MLHQVHYVIIHAVDNLQPSKTDKEITNEIKEVAKFLYIKVMGHIIVSEEGYYSFADEGRV